ncbi:MAG TPA: NAD(P)/FAD-dependent oxidoreductase, partial [Clostridiales bacterium]|nr:NAD(P)/FAD-dependent oxidoreductase [Clostridiales bacterium]
MKIAVLGGGAAGLAAAVTVARGLPEASVFLYEKNNEPGKKILATGNGRCNLSNAVISPAFYRGDVALIHLILDHFQTADCLAFFQSMGLYTLEEEGRIYPRTMAAATVRDILVQEMERLGIIVKSGTAVTSLKRVNALPEGKATLSVRDRPSVGFLINETEYADYVILATGGKAGSKFGSDGDGYRLLKALHIHYHPISPALVSLLIREDISGLHGLRVHAGIWLTDADGN